MSARIRYPNVTDQSYLYDGLLRLKTTLSAGSILGTPARQEDWTLDQLGNWPGFVQKANGSTTLNQARTYNAANEVTEIDSSSTHVAEDTAEESIRE